ncbi:hypothetical protein SK128_016588 [Halocaridina rubra]|uniref:COMM domain-containing protein n=1 Tax=Halocaridina rubra TaxID=373956 RepID=A0AAN8WSZ7_HALRR
MKSNESEGTFPLTRIPAHSLIKFVHHVIDEMCGGVCVSHENYEETPLDTFWIATQTVKTLAQSIAVENTTEDEALTFLQALDKELSQEIYEALQSRKEEVTKFMVQESIASTRHLKDFDWNVKLAVASDKVLNLNEPYVSLQLHTSTGTTDFDEDTKNISVEMTLTEVDRLLENLKEVQKKLTDYQSNKVAIKN